VSTLRDIERELENRPKAKGRNSHKREAARTFELTPEHFAEDYDGRPVAPIVVGLRVPSESEAMTIEAAARNEAAQADDEHDYLSRYNRSVQTYWVARALCDPHDVTSPHPFFDMPEDLVPVAFKPQTIERLMAEIGRLGVEQSPLHPEADTEELAELADLLATEEPFADVDFRLECLARRYLKFALEILRSE
jgi:hypothetical protein